MELIKGVQENKGLHHQFALYFRLLSVAVILVEEMCCLIKLSRLSKIKAQNDFLSAAIREVSAITLEGNRNNVVFTM